MKKYLKLFLMPLVLGIVALSTLALTSCGGKDIASVEVDTTTIPEEIVQGELDEALAEMKLVVTLENGSKSSVAITKDMISANDLEKLSDIGTYYVTVVYEGYEVEVKFVIVEAEEVVELTDINLTVDNPTVSVEYGASHSALTGVKAVGNDGVSYASKLTYVISNAAGQTVDKLDTYVENEVYTVVISINFAGISKSVTKTVTIGAKPDTSGNLIPSGEFTMTGTDYDGWAVYSDQSTVAYESEVIGGSTFAKVVEEAVASFAYSPRLNNTTGNYFQLYTGTAYKVSFQAKALAKKNIQCQIGQLVGGAPYFYDFALQQFPFEIGTEMATYSFTFIASNTAGGDMSCSSVTFELGTVNSDATATTIWLGNVVVEEFSGEIADTQAPAIDSTPKNVWIGDAEVVDLTSLITANDIIDGAITPTFVIKNEAGETIDSISGLVAGVYTVEVTAVDAAGNEATATVTVTVREKPGTSVIDFNLEDQTLGFIEEVNMTAGQLGYWNDQNWCGSNVTVTSATVANKEINLAYTSTGANTFGLQFFYKNADLIVGETYNLVLVINTQNAMTAGINGKTFELVAGDNNINVEYVEGDISSIDIQFGIVEAVAANEIKLSSIQWKYQGSSEIGFNLEDQTLDFIEEVNMTAGQLGYWNDQNWCGSNVTVTSATVANKEINLAYTSTGANTFGLQFFYKNADLAVGTMYVLKMILTVENAITAGINNKTFELVAGANEIEVVYLEGDISSIDIQFGVVEAITANTIKLSSITWDLAEVEEPEGPTEIVESEVFTAVDGPISNSGEDVLEKGSYAYWNDQNWCGSNVTVSSATVADNALSVTYTATGVCDFGLQFFYKSNTLTAGQTYRLTLTITVENAVAAKVNDTAVNLVAGANTVEVTYIQGTGVAASGVSSLDIQIAISDACLANTVTLSNISWNLVA